MTSLGYTFAKILAAFGIRRNRERWAAINREMLALADAERELGKAAWRELTAIEGFGAECGKLAAMEDEQARLREEAEALEGEGAALHAEATRERSAAAGAQGEIRSKRGAAIAKANEARVKYAEARTAADRAKKRFADLQAKLKALRAAAESGGPNEAEIEAARAALVEVKDEYAARIAEADELMKALDAANSEPGATAGEAKTGPEMERGTPSEAEREFARKRKRLFQLKSTPRSNRERKGKVAAEIGKLLSRDPEPGSRLPASWQAGPLPIRRARRQDPRSSANRSSTTKRW
ncbi:MAG: hypothetical protein R3F11_02840 [Verrucomicrobiales bacterium]